MNKITREHYPAKKLPADLREGVDPASTVTVTVTVESPSASAGRSRDLIDMLFGARQAAATDGDPVTRIRELRDEWDR